LAIPVRTRPLIAVLSRVPLFVEAMAAAFAGTADVQAISPDDLEAHGLLRAFRPDAVIVEGWAPFVPSDIPCVTADLAAETLTVRLDGGWRVVGGELSPELIRNAVVALLYGGAIT
jgi:hypothetical protein